MGAHYIEKMPEIIRELYEFPYMQSVDIEVPFGEKHSENAEYISKIGDLQNHLEHGYYMSYNELGFVDLYALRIFYALFISHCISHLFMLIFL